MNNNDDWFIRFIVLTTIFIFLFGLFVAYNVDAKSCEYDNQTTSTMQGTIESLEVKVTRVCSRNIRINQEFKLSS